MKKVILAFVLVLLFVNIAFAAELIYKKGTVQIMRKGQDFWIQANPGARVEEGDKVKTFKGSVCEIAFDSAKKNILKVDEDTQVTMESFGQTVVSMDKGKVLSRLKGLEAGSTFEVRTPTAVAGAAGTGWGVETDGQRTTVLVFENSVYLCSPRNPNEKRIISEGNKTTISRLDRIGVVDFVILTRLDNDRWGTWVKELEERLEEKGRMDRLRELDDRIKDRFGDTQDR